MIMMNTICKAQIHMVSIVHAGYHTRIHADPLTSRETCDYDEDMKDKTT